MGSAPATGRGARHLVVTGPMGVGKTTLADRLGTALDRSVRDSDRDLGALFGRTGRAIAASDGVDALHDLESAVLLGALAGPTPLVVAAAGWVVEDPRCREALARRAVVVALDLPNDRLVERLARGGCGEGHRRPMAPTEVDDLARRRGRLYTEVADVRLDATLPIHDLVTAVRVLLGERA